MLADDLLNDKIRIFPDKSGGLRLAPVWRKFRLIDLSDTASAKTKQRFDEKGIHPGQQPDGTVFTDETLLAVIISILQLHQMRDRTRQTVKIEMSRQFTVQRMNISGRIQAAHQPRVEYIPGNIFGGKSLISLVQPKVSPVERTHPDRLGERTPKFGHGLFFRVSAQPATCLTENGGMVA